MPGNNNSNSGAVTGYVLGQSNGNMNAAQAQADARVAGQQADYAIAAMGALRQQVDAWKARFERERATRRGWQQNGMAARDLIQKLANVDREGAQKLIDQAYEQNKARIDASVAGVDEWKFTGVKPGTSQQ